MQSATLYLLLLAMSGKQVQETPAYATLRMLYPDFDQLQTSQQRDRALEYLRKLSCRRISYTQHATSPDEMGMGIETTFFVPLDVQLTPALKPRLSETLYIHPTLSQQSVMTRYDNAFSEHGVSYIECNHGSLATLVEDPSIHYFSTETTTGSRFNIMPVNSNCDTLPKALTYIRKIIQDKLIFIHTACKKAEFPMIAAQAQEVKDFLNPEDRTTRTVDFKLVNPTNFSNGSISDTATHITYGQYSSSKFYIKPAEPSLVWLDYNAGYPQRPVAFAAVCAPETYIVDFYPTQAFAGNLKVSIAQ